MTCGIYMIRNKVSHKVYVGQSGNIPVRLANHKMKLTQRAHGNKHLQAAWNQYGSDAFEFKIVELCVFDSLTKREQYHINLWKPFGLYNSSLVAGRTRFGVPHSEEDKKAISRALTGRKASEQRKQKISKALKGRIFTPEWKKKISESLKELPYFSEEHRKKLSNTHKGRPKSEEHKRKISEARKAYWQRVRDGNTAKTT